MVNIPWMFCFCSLCWDINPKFSTPKMLSCKWAPNPTEFFLSNMPSQRIGLILRWNIGHDSWVIQSEVLAHLWKCKEVPSIPIWEYAWVWYLGVFKDFNKWLEKVQLRQPRMHEGNLSAWTVAPKESTWWLQGSKLCLDPNWFVSPTSCLHAHELLTKGGTWAVPGEFFYPFNTTVESCSGQSRMCFSNCERRLNSAGSRDLLTLANSEEGATGWIAAKHDTWAWKTSITMSLCKSGQTNRTNPPSKTTRTCEEGLNIKDFAPDGPKSRFNTNNGADFRDARALHLIDIIVWLHPKTFRNLWPEDENLKKSTAKSLHLAASEVASKDSSTKVWVCRQGHRVSGWAFCGISEVRNSRPLPG